MLGEWLRAMPAGEMVQWARAEQAVSALFFPPILVPLCMGVRNSIFKAHSSYLNRP